LHYRLIIRELYCLVVNNQTLWLRSTNFGGCKGGGSESSSERRENKIGMCSDYNEYESVETYGELAVLEV